MSVVPHTWQVRRFIKSRSYSTSCGACPVIVMTFIAMLEPGKDTLVETARAEARTSIQVSLTRSST